MRAPRVLLAFLVVSLLIPGAHAQAGPQETTIDHDTVWDGQDQVVKDGVLNVTDNATLTIRGITVTLMNASVNVEAGSKLIVESLPGRAARFVGGDGPGWGARVEGDFSFVGTESDPVVLDGLRGQTGKSGQTIFFQGGFTLLDGTGTLSHVIVTNYSAGFLAGEGGTLNADHATFNSTSGVAALVSRATGNFTNVDFHGAGGTLFVTVPSVPVRMQNLSFEGAGTALTVRGSILHIRDVNVRDSATCFLAIAGDILDFDGFTCTNFTSHAVDLEPAQVGNQGTPELHLKHFSIRTESPVDSAVLSVGGKNLTLADGALGPIAGNALRVASAGFNLTNVTFTGVTGFGAAITDLPRNDTLPVLPANAGAMGNFQLLKTSVFRVRDSRGVNLTGENFTAYYTSNGTIAFQQTNVSLAAFRLPLEFQRIDGSGHATNVTYRIEAQDGPDTGTMKDFYPDGREWVLTVHTKNAPGVALVPALGAVLVALALRRRR